MKPGASKALVAALSLLLNASPTEESRLYCHDSGSLRIIERYDFANASYPVWTNGPDESPHFALIDTNKKFHEIRLRGGQYEQPRRFNGQPDDPEPLVALSKVGFGDIDHDGQQEAVVHLQVRSNGTQTWGFLYVFKLKGSRICLIQAFRTGDRAYEGLKDFQARVGSLVLEIYDPQGRAGDCCSKSVEEITFNWIHGKLRQSSKRLLELKGPESPSRFKKSF